MTDVVAHDATSRESMIGFAAALTAFLTWGFFPLYVSLIDDRVSAWEILAHRILWTALFLGLFAVVSGRVDRVAAVIARPRRLAWLLLTAVLVATNWGVFIWAVIHERVLEASLGYYINPLFNVALGLVFLGERLRRAQWLAVAIAACGVLFMVAVVGRLPWVSLALAGSFGSYGLIRKQLDVDSLTGLLIETLALAPIAIIALAVFYYHGQAMFGRDTLTTDVLLIGAGIMTIVPFTAFVAGARRLRLATLGLVQYITPSLHFATGILILGETFSPIEGVTFVCIWIGLAIYTLDLWRHRERRN